MEDSLMPDLPFSARREFAEIQGFGFQLASGGGAQALPTALLATQALVLQSDRQVTVKLGDIVLNPGGIIVVYNGTVATDPPTVTNASGLTANIRGVALGG